MILKAIAYLIIFCICYSYGGVEFGSNNILGVSSSATAYNTNVYDLELALLSHGVNQINDKSTAAYENQKDYSATYVKSKEGAVKIYRPKVFKDIRKKLNIQDERFMNNLLPQNLICIANSDSKSGGRFWISTDGLFVVKTLKHYECKSLKAIMDQYQYHVMSNDKCSIASILGIYRVKLKGHLFSKYYLVSRNVFPLLGTKDTYIYKKYDLKGSTYGRTASIKSSVEKDVDLMKSGQFLHLGHDLKPVFLKTLENDVTFLKRQMFMDYSLLVSIEHSPTKNFKRFPLNKKLPKFGSSLDEDRGKLVVLGSDGNTYHFGIIDFLQRYTFRKRIEYFIKSLFFGSSSISCVPPNYYAQRMINFIDAYSE